MPSEKLIKWTKEQGIVMMFIQPRKPNQNAFVDRLNKSFKDKGLNVNLLNSVDQAQEVAVNAGRNFPALAGRIYPHPWEFTIGDNKK